MTVESFLAHIDLEAADGAVLIVRDDGAIVAANKLAHALFRYAAEVLTTCTVEDLLPFEARTRHRAHRASYAANPNPRPMGVGFKLPGLRADGTTILVEVSLWPLVGAPGHTYAIVREAGASAMAHARAVMDRIEAKLGAKP